MCAQYARIGFWQVSTHGRVCDTLGRISFGARTCSGYLQVRIGEKSYLVHRLVAFAHLRQPPTSLHDTVLHVDGNKANNCLSNLKYGTSQECRQFAAQSTLGRARLNACKVVLSRAPGERTWARHDSATAAAEARGVADRTVRLCCLHGRAMRSGMEFRHASHENLPGEKWKPALHPLTGSKLANTMISSKGRVFNGRGICTWGSLTPAGYFAVHTSAALHLVHRLVLSSFAASLPSYAWVGNHIDGNKQNNSLENLEFATHAENADHAVRTKLRKPSCQLKPVLGRPLGSMEWIHFESVAAAAAHARCSKGAVSNVGSGRYESMKGWEFQYVCNDSALPGEQWAPVVLPLTPPAA